MIQQKICERKTHVSSVFLVYAMSCKGAVLSEMKRKKERKKERK